MHYGNEHIANFGWKEWSKHKDFLRQEENFTVICKIARLCSGFMVVFWQPNYRRKRKDRFQTNCKIKCAPTSSRDKLLNNSAAAQLKQQQTHSGMEEMRNRVLEVYGVAMTSETENDCSLRATNISFLMIPKISRGPAALRVQTSALRPKMYTTRDWTVCMNLIAEGWRKTTRLKALLFIYIYV